MGQSIKPGTAVPLSVNLGIPPSVPAFVQATINDDTCVSLGAQALTACADGREFKSSAFLMPNTLSITVKYKVYSNAAFTVPHIDFLNAESVEIFSRLEQSTGSPVIFGRLKVRVRDKGSIRLSVSRTKKVRLGISAENIRLKVRDTKKISLNVGKTKVINFRVSKVNNVSLTVQDCK